ncbi:OTU domain [Sesbania bispinosa]|nr:OTU domain [Sesbania bispinosa]
MDESDGWWSKVFDDVRMPYNVDGFSVPNSTLVDEFDEEMVLPKKEIVDFSDVFTTDEIFESRDELLNWVRGIAMDHGFVVVIMRSDSGGIDRKIKLILGCERSGKYRPYKSELVRNVTGSRKCECPFRLRGRPLANGVGWKLNVVCGVHNHEVAESLEGHPYAGRLTVEEKSLLEDMTKNMVKPQSILLTLKDHNVHNVTTIKQIYNARTAFRKSERGPRTELQHLMNLMEHDNYLYWHRRAETSDVVRDIMWAHPDAVKLLNLFHIVLIIDTTYKTNKYRLPLLEIAVVTSIELTFSVAFAYLEHFGLMNAIQSVFPSSYNLLCQFHIAKNVKVKCKQLVAPSTLHQPVMDAWMSVIQSPTEVDFDDRFAQFEELCPPTFFDYVNKTWITPHKEKFVAAWIDRVMHLGNTTTNRVESAHARLKRLLQDSRGDICNCWDAMNNLIILQHTEIKASFQRSIMNLGHQFNNRLYVEKVHAHWRRLTFTDQISEAECAGVTLHLELNELERRFDEFNMDGKVAFKYKVRELAFPNTTSMCPPPEKVRKKGSTKGQSQTESSTKRDPSFFEYVDAMQSPNDSNSTRPSSSILHTKTQKRKKVMPMLDQFPTVMHDFIESVVDVARDGNCGYRAISALLGMGEESWPIIRQELYREICYWHHDYAQLFGDEQRC